MKSKKKIVKITVIVLFIIAIILTVYYFYNDIFKVEGEARLVKIDLPAATEDLKCSFDEVKKEKLEWKEAISIKGWVYKQNLKGSKRDLYLVLVSKNKNLIFKIEKNNINRPDVSNFFKMEEATHNYGFEINLPVYLLKENAYQIGFMLIKGMDKYYTLTSKALSISEGSVTLNNFHQELESSKSSSVSITLKVPTCKINCGFDNVTLSGNTLTISGWGFLQGLNTESLKSYILLKKNEKVAVFSVLVQPRNDVTIFYKTTGLNLDASGFLAQIATEGMEKGHYQVGLYIEKGNQTGLIYTDKYLDLGK
jgi:hypothetical protein